MSSLSEAPLLLFFVHAFDFVIVVVVVGGSSRSASVDDPSDCNGNAFDGRMSACCHKKRQQRPFGGVVAVTKQS